MNRWDAYVEDPGGSYLLRIGRDNQMVLTVESKPGGGDITGWVQQEHSADFRMGWLDADLDLDPDNELAFDVNAYQDGLVPPSEQYCDGYTARWFPITDAPVTCGLRTDLPRKQRVHDYVSLGKDFKNQGELGIVEVIVFACSTCGKDWR